jgi:hypothetical protein
LVDEDPLVASDEPSCVDIRLSVAADWLDVSVIVSPHETSGSRDAAARIKRNLFLNIGSLLFCLRKL